MLKTHIPFLVFPAFPGSGLPSSECRVFSAQCSEMEGLCFGTDQGLRVAREMQERSMNPGPPKSLELVTIFNPEDLLPHTLAGVSETQRDCKHVPQIL